MSDEKYANIARLMTSYNFEIEELPDYLKCAKCKLVLKDACQVPCGCTFCRACINDMMVSGGEFCPGVSEYCGQSRLPLFKSDYKANNSVCKLSAKCPHNGCVLQCQLANMDEHLRECPRRNVECPFCELGCTQSTLIAEEVDGHLEQENRRHSEILIGMIANVNREMEERKREIGVLKQRDEENRREIDVLKRSDETNRREIEMLNQINHANKKEIDILNERDEHSKREIEVMKCDLILKTDQIRTVMDQMVHVDNENKSIRNDLKSMQEGKEDVAVRVRILTEKIEQEIDERRENGELDSARVIEHIDREITAVTGLIGSNKDELMTEMKAVKDDIQSINEETDSTKAIICSIRSQVQSIQALVGQIDVSCEWLIDEDIWKMSSNKEHRKNCQFRGKGFQYIYQLASYNCGDELCIYLCIFPGLWDGPLTWPFEGRVVITVADINRRDACRTISRQCKIERPSNNGCAISDYFRFRHSELRLAGLVLDRGVHVSCVIAPSHF